MLSACAAPPRPARWAALATSAVRQPGNPGKAKALSDQPVTDLDRLFAGKPGHAANLQEATRPSDLRKRRSGWRTACISRPSTPLTPQVPILRLRGYTGMQWRRQPPLASLSTDIGEVSVSPDYRSAVRCRPSATSPFLFQSLSGRSSTPASARVSSAPPARRNVRRCGSADRWPAPGHSCPPALGLVDLHAGTR